MFSEDRIKGFDGIRAFAALSVVATHLHLYNALERCGVPNAFIKSVNGSAAVQIFFVLSGFLITFLLIDEFKKKKGISLRNFFIRRALRIFPLYYFMVIATFVVFLVGDHVAGAKAFPFAFAYIYNFIPKQWYAGILGHTWSLAVEGHFYLVWPFVFSAAALNYKKLITILMAFCGFSFLAALTLSSSVWIVEHFFIERWSFTAGVNIAFGCILAMLMFGSPYNELWVRRVGGLAAFWFSLFLWFFPGFATELNYWIVQYLRGAGMAVFIGWLYVNQKSLLVSVLDVLPLRYLGLVSYGIYMYQGFFLGNGPERLMGQTWPLSPFWGVILLIFTVPISYHFFEKPIIGMKRRLQR